MIRLHSVYEKSLVGSYSTLGYSYFAAQMRRTHLAMAFISVSGIYFQLGKKLPLMLAINQIPIKM